MNIFGIANLYSNSSEIGPITIAFIRNTADNSTFEPDWDNDSKDATFEIDAIKNL